jgi:hypothetical protein
VNTKGDVSRGWTASPLSGRAIRGPRRRVAGRRRPLTQAAPSQARERLRCCGSGRLYYVAPDGLRGREHGAGSPP